MQDHVNKESSNMVEPLKVAHDPGKFGGHRYFGNGDMFLVCHVILQDHVITWLCDYMGRTSSIYVTILPSWS